MHGWAHIMQVYKHMTTQPRPMSACVRVVNIQRINATQQLGRSL